MSLIQCPECDGTISDKANICPHCGFPLKEDNKINTKCTIDNISYDFTDVINCVNQEKNKDAFLKIRDIYPLSFHNCLNIIEFIKLTNSVPEHYEIKEYAQKDEENAYKQILSMKNDNLCNKIKCPTCSSNNIKKISVTKKAVGALSFGLLSKTAQSQFECLNCGYKW